MQKQAPSTKPPSSLEEKEILYEIEEVVVKKIYDIKADLNRHYSDIVKHDDEFLSQAYNQLEVVCHNQLKRLDDWKENYINSTNMTYEGTSEIIEHQKEAANKDASQRILDYIAFKAKLLIDQFPEQATYFKNLGWKSPIIIPETFKYPFRPEANGSSADFKSIMFPEFENKNPNGYRYENDDYFDTGNKFESSDSFESSNEYENDDNDDLIDITKNDTEIAFNNHGNFNQSETMAKEENNYSLTQPQNNIVSSNSLNENKIENNNNENHNLPFNYNSFSNYGNIGTISSTQNNNNHFETPSNNTFDFPQSFDNSNDKIEKKNSFEANSNEFSEQEHYGTTMKTDISNDFSSHDYQSTTADANANNFDTQINSNLNESNNNEENHEHDETHFNNENQFNQPLDNDSNNTEKGLNESNSFENENHFSDENQSDEETKKDRNKEEEEEEEDSDTIESGIGQPLLTARIVLGQLNSGDNAILNLPEGLALYGRIESFDRYSIKFVTDENEEMQIPTTQFEDKRFFFQRAD